MCLILLAYDQHPRYRLIVAANRDELHERPTQQAHPWPDVPGIIAGRDLERGGTWMGVDSRGRFAAVTNYRDVPLQPEAARSRGVLVSEFLQSSATAPDYSRDLLRRGGEYGGFSLFVWDGSKLVWASNRSSDLRILSPGIYGLGNALLDSDEPKVRRARASFEEALQDGETSVLMESLLSLLADRGAPSDALADPAELSLFEPIFVSAGPYGTRSSTVLLLDSTASGLFVERSWSAAGEETGTVRLELPAGSSC